MCSIGSGALTGGLNYYRASPLYPPIGVDPGASAVHLDPADEDTSVMTVTCTSSLDAAASIWPVFERLVASLQPAAQRSPSGSYAQASAGWAKR